MIHWFRDSVLIWKLRSQHVAGCSFCLCIFFFILTRELPFCFLFRDLINHPVSISFQIRTWTLRNFINIFSLFFLVLTVSESICIWMCILKTSDQKIKQVFNLCCHLLRSFTGKKGNFHKLLNSLLYFFIDASVIIIANQRKKKKPSEIFEVDRMEEANKTNIGEFMMTAYKKQDAKISRKYQ